MTDEFHAEGGGPEVLRWGAADVDGLEAEAEAGQADGQPAAEGGRVDEVDLGERESGGAGDVPDVELKGRPASGRGGEAEPDDADAAAVRIVPVSLQEFHDAGLIWLANRALHPFGYALSVQAVVEADEHGDWLGPARVVEEAGLRVVRTTDPLGLVFSEESENRSRGRFFAWLAARPPATAPVTRGGDDGPAAGE